MSSTTEKKNDHISHPSDQVENFHEKNLIILFLGPISCDKVECKFTLNSRENYSQYGEKFQLKLSEILPCEILL